MEVTGPDCHIALRIEGNINTIPHCLSADPGDDDHFAHFALICHVLCCLCIIKLSYRGSLVSVVSSLTDVVCCIGM